MQHMNERNFLLIAEGITKIFPGVVALDNVSFDLKPGEIHGLLGQNGAGKSTLLKILYGYYAPDKGRIIIKGNEVKLKTPRDARNHGISFSTQEITLLPHLTVLENIMLLGSYWNKEFSYLNKEKILDYVLELIKEYGIEINPNEKVRYLGTANKMIVQVLASLSMNADIFLFDEPTSPLSPYEVEKIFNLINMLKSKGKGVVFVTHRVDEALKICDRITVLRNGKKIGTVDAHKTNEEELIEMMLGTQIHEFYFVEEGKEMKEITKIETPLIELRGIYSIPTKPTEVPLRNVNLRIYENEVVTVFGIIGAGKTELGKLLIGITKMARGDIYYKGKKIKIKSPAHALSKYGIFYLTEDRRAEGIIPLLSVLANMSISAFKNVSLGGILINAFKERELGTRFVKELDIKAPSLYVRASNLSGGNQQKVLLARALMTSAKLLIIDEPTVGIDIGAKIEIRRTIREISSKKGISVLVLTSDLDEALGIGERVYFMHNGTIVSEYTNNNPDEIRRKIISDFSNIIKK